MTAEVARWGWGGAEGERVVGAEEMAKPWRRAKLRWRAARHAGEVEWWGPVSGRELALGAGVARVGIGVKGGGAVVEEEVRVVAELARLAVEEEVLGAVMAQWVAEEEVWGAVMARGLVGGWLASGVVVVQKGRRETEVEWGGRREAEVALVGRLGAEMALTRVEEAEVLSAEMARTKAVEAEVLGGAGDGEVHAWCAVAEEAGMDVGVLTERVVAAVVVVVAARAQLSSATAVVVAVAAVAREVAVEVRAAVVWGGTPLGGSAVVGVRTAQGR